ncbi:MAG: methyltransferase domain-containing protein [Candidatus Diapherotrites archaeon]|nr:methyltransferase domain-containing protein [Candidatus Diapherotrites archaeon]
MMANPKTPRTPLRQRVRRRYSVKERLERRGVRLVPHREKGDILWDSDRNYAEYRKRTGIDFEALFKGKRVLDVGCGDGMFVHEARNREILAEGIDPAAPNREGFHRMHLDEFFPDHKFACVVAVKSLPVIPKDAYSRRLAIYDMLRLAEPGGIVVIHLFQGNLSTPRRNDSAGLPSSTLRKLQKSGFELVFPKDYEERLIIKKKNEKQVEHLGKLLGVI